MNNDDPIIAAIEAHRHACAETWAAYERRNAVEDELVAEVRSRRARLKVIRTGLLPMMQRERRWLCRMTLR